MAILVITRASFAPKLPKLSAGLPLHQKSIAGLEPLENTLGPTAGGAVEMESQGLRNFAIHKV